MSGQSSKKIPVTIRGRDTVFKLPGRRLDPFEGAFPVEPDVTDDQDPEKNEHAR
jgi:hypothetical protein